MNRQSGAGGVQDHDGVEARRLSRLAAAHHIADYVAGDAGDSARRRRATRTRTGASHYTGDHRHAGRAYGCRAGSGHNGCRVDQCIDSYTLFV